MEDPRLRSLLERIGMAALRPLQALVINQILEAARPDSEALRRRLVVLPTGYGKTLCFALPAFLLPHPTLVIYPLRALMTDQARRFEELGLSCTLLIGGLETAELARRIGGIKNGQSRIILANPEMLLVPHIRNTLATVHFSHVVLDEAHVAGIWGRTFRPAYRELGACLHGMRADQISAFTATADAEARLAIRELLGDSCQSELSGPIDRPEIRYEVLDTRMPELSLQGLLWKTGNLPSQAGIECPALVFVRNRSLCEQLSLRFRHLDAARQGLIRYYHAGLSRNERWHLEHWFYHSRDGILVTTNAYGMGVDKADIRTVIHYGVPDSASSYLQECGRAARDGRSARAICLVDLSQPLHPDPLMARFLSGRECRRTPLLEALLDHASGCGGCDVCHPAGDRLPPEIAAVLHFLRKNGRQYTLVEAGKAIHRAGVLGILGRIQLDTLLREGLKAGWLRESLFPLSWRRIIAVGKTESSGPDLRVK